MCSLRIDPLWMEIASDVLFDQNIERKVSEKELEINGLSYDVKTLVEWAEEAQKAIDIIHETGVRYALIKTLDVPHVRMTDVDVLIEHPLELLQAAEALNDEGYELFKFRLQNHPLKIAAKRKKTQISIDIYPEPSWVQLTSADRYVVTLHREKRVIHGVTAYVPKPWLDAYLIATHSYSHGRIRLAEVLGTLRALTRSQKGMTEMLEQAEKWRMTHTMFIYLTLCVAFAKHLGIACPSAFQTAKLLRFDRIARIADEWLRTEQPVSLPLEIPTNLRFKSSAIRAIYLIEKGQKNAFGEAITMMLNELGRRVLVK